MRFASMTKISEKPITSLSESINSTKNIHTERFCLFIADYIVRVAYSKYQIYSFRRLTALDKQEGFRLSWDLIVAIWARSKQVKLSFLLIASGWRQAWSY